MTKGINLSDLLGNKCIDTPMSYEERKAFWDKVHERMRDLGYIEANGITERSTLLTERDYELLESLKLSNNFSARIIPGKSLPSWT